MDDLGIGRDTIQNPITVQASKQQRPGRRILPSNLVDPFTHGIDDPNSVAGPAQGRRHVSQAERRHGAEIAQIVDRLDRRRLNQADFEWHEPSGASVSDPNRGMRALIVGGFEVPYVAQGKGCMIRDDHRQVGREAPARPMK